MSLLQKLQRSTLETKILTEVQVEAEDKASAMEGRLNVLENGYQPMVGSQSGSPSHQDVQDIEDKLLL